MHAERWERAEWLATAALWLAGVVVLAFPLTVRMTHAAEVRAGSPVGESQLACYVQAIHWHGWALAVIAAARIGLVGLGRYWEKRGLGLDDDVRGSVVGVVFREIGFIAAMVIVFAVVVGGTGLAYG